MQIEDSQASRPLRLFYWNRAPNFGDQLNAWMWPRLTGIHFTAEAEDQFVGIGTVLNDSLPSARKTLVFGSGSGYGPPPSIDDSWTIYCLRGPLTCQSLGLSRELALTDPAILVRLLPRPDAAQDDVIAYMPHWRSSSDWLADAVGSLGLRYIDPARPVEEVLRSICRSRFLIAEAMHGAIVADALRIPWVAVDTSRGSSLFKWIDWTRSLEMGLDPLDLPPVRRVGSGSRNLRSRVKRSFNGSFPRRLKASLGSLRPNLSEESRMSQLEQQLVERMQALEQDWLAGA